MWTMRIFYCIWWVLTIIAVIYCPSSNGQQYGQVEFRIKEQMPSGTNVGSIRDRARIADKVQSRELSSLSFKFLNPNNLLQTASLFSINSDNGAVYTTAMIDRESVCQFQEHCNVEFEVTVTSSMSKFFEIVGVRIVIEDINDNAPRFPNDEVTLFISESVNVNSEFRIAGATDKDTARENSVRKYEMRSEHNDMFELKSEKKLDGTWDLSIVTLKPLDRETKDHYLLHIVAKDEGNPPRSGNVTVHINVTDTNDNPPIFTDNVYNFSVPEQAEIGAVVGQVLASDADSGMNAAVTYKFSPARSSEMDNLFYIDSQSGEIKVKSELQYEAGKTFETIVVASDRGNPPRASQAVLDLKILDVGNTPPRISINPVPNPEGNVLTISEASPMETVVAHVRTDDRDKGPNGIVDCYSASSMFRIRRFEGSGFLVELNQQLDRETESEVNVTIVCEDRGMPKLSAYGWFLIKLLDDNDNDPIFTKQIYRANLTENNIRGQHVLFVKAYDRDLGENAQLHYSISMESAESSFLIDPGTGEITAGQVFDRETVSQISFMVMAVDGGQRSGITSVVVDIEDENDNSPYFTSSMEFQVAEGLPASSQVDILEASDRDEGPNGQVSFFMPDEDFRDSENPIPFVVMTNGVIRTTNVLDKDKQNLYKFPVVVKDNGNPSRSSSATVTIHVIDSNDHRPVFVFPTRKNQTVRVRSDSTPGSFVAQLKATDDDVGRNARLKYSIKSGNHERVFVLNDPSTGIVRLTNDTEILSNLQTSVFHLNVSVKDQGIPVLEANSVLMVQIDYVDGHGMGRTRTDDTNSTSSLDENDIKYIIIAGVVGGVTVIISIIIVTIILLMRRPDNNNRAAGVSGVQEQGDGRHFDKQLWQSVPVDDVTPTEVDEKKIGSMSLKGGGGGVGSGGGGSIDPKTSNGGFTPNCNNDLIDPYGRKHAAEPYHGQPQLYTFKKCALRAPADDHQSDTSGETTTSDSGRGGSEEDIQLPPLPELCEDTSRIIFKNPGAGLKDSRFVQSDYPDYRDRDVIAFQTFSPRTLPGSTDAKDKSPYGGRDAQTIGHSGRSLPDKHHRHNRQGNYGHAPASYQSQPSYHLSTHSPVSVSGPGHYPDDIPERTGDSTSSKKVTFQTDLTTQNLKTWDLCQKMNLQKEAAASRGTAGHHGHPGTQRGSYGNRPRSQDDDDNTTTSGSYTINPENDFDENLPAPYSMA